MNGPKMIDALQAVAALGGHDEILSPRAAWLTTPDGKVHAEVHSGLDETTLTPQDGSLKDYLAALKCNRRACRSIQGIFGESVMDYAAIAQAYIEARHSMLRAPRDGYDQLFGDRSLNDTPLRRLIGPLGSDHELLNRYLDKFAKELSDARQEFVNSMRSETKIKEFLDEIIELLIISKYKVLSNLQVLLSTTRRPQPSETYDGYRGHGSPYLGYEQPWQKQTSGYALDRLQALAQVRSELDKLFPTTLQQVSNLTPEQLQDLGSKNPGESLLALMAKAWRADVLTEVMTVEERVAELRKELREDSRRYAVHLPRNIETTLRYRFGDNLRVMFGWNPEARIAILPGVVVDHMELAPRLVGDQQPSELYTAQFVELARVGSSGGALERQLLEIAETLLKDNAEMTLRDAWGMATALVR